MIAFLRHKMDENEDAGGSTVGIMEWTNGRAWMIHNCCGVSLVLNGVLKFK